MTRLRTTRHILLAVALLMFGAVLGVQFDSYLSADDALQQFEKLKRAFVVISGRYVEPVDAAEMTEEGVKGMVNSLDPHSSYIPSKQVRDTRDRYEGSFGGIGIRFEPGDTARVIAPISGGPSQKVGIMAGDRIVEIGDLSAIGLSGDEIQNRLKGKIGTSITVTIYRPLADKRLTFTIERDKIPLYSVNSAYLMDEQTGYIEIGRFSMSTHQEFLNKVDTLRKQGMERLVLDLRDNPGGVMQSAVRIGDEFLGEGMTIVRTKGRSPEMDTQYRGEEGGVFGKDPVIVLVNRRSASASEILAGALQDHDRALIVGRRTFGKALVQKQFELNDGSLLQMTVGRYYTPVGRLIQTPYEKGKRDAYYEEKSRSWRDAVYDVETYKESIPDSLTYRTDHGRTVFGGGGIMPDHVVAPDTSSLATFIRESQVDALFAREWFSQNEQELRSTWQSREDAFLSSYEVPKKAVDAFWTYTQKEDVLTLTTTPDSVNLGERIYRRSEADSVRTLVQSRLKGHLANTLYGSGVGRPILNKADPIVQRAATLWPSSRELAAYHTTSASSSRNEE
ncbi:MAG: S41 family peptidase [Bacteroidetes bacterium SW_9_63_38]|nr:MAG: S41 family peptidase [Bacteroidetes bacterium SW_9_63_38]